MFAAPRGPPHHERASGVLVVLPAAITPSGSITKVGLLLPGQSRESDPLRTWGFHDHNDSDNPRWTGTIQVK